MNASSGEQAQHQDFLQDLAELSQIGATPAGGVDRQAATIEDGEARQWLSHWFRSHDFSVVVDEVGNLFGVVTFDTSAPYVLAGSHLDSQPTAGRLDGAYGVLTAAYAVKNVRDKALQDGIKPLVNFVVVDWFNEEGSRFAPSVMGSGVYARKLAPQAVLATEDRSGTSVKQALADIGYLGSETPPDAVAYAEIHVEQGRLLESENVDIGLVISNWVVCKFKVTIKGEQAHTGTADMDDRRDALVGAAKVLLGVRDFAIGPNADQLLASVGEVAVYPNVPGVVASKAVLSLDVRAPEEEFLKQQLDVLKEKILLACESEGLSVHIPEMVMRSSVRFSESGIAVGRKAAESCDLSYKRMCTRAGHDAINMNTIVPTLLAFVPSKSGISHCESEDTDKDDLLKGLDFFCEVLSDVALNGAFY